MYGYLPALAKVTVSVAVDPGESSFVFLPAILKSCGRPPLFVTLNVTVPCMTVFGITVKANSLGAPGETRTTVAVEPPCRAAAGSAHVSTASVAIMPSIRTRFLLTSKDSFRPDDTPHQMTLASTLEEGRLRGQWA